MKVKKLLGILLIIGIIILAIACSSSRKVKKKCRECPEFSLQESPTKQSKQVYGRI